MVLRDDVGSRTGREFTTAGEHVKDIFEVLTQKRAELERLKREVEALQIAARLLAEDIDAQPIAEKTPTLTSAPQIVPNVPSSPSPIASAPAPTPVPVPNPRPAAPRQGGYSAAWENSPATLPDIEDLHRKGA